MVISCCSREVKPASRKEGGEQKVVPPPSTANPPPISITPLDLDHHYNFEPTSSTSSKPSSSSSAGQLSEMSRESRHVRVDGLLEGMTQERLKDFFAGFGRVQKVLKVASDVEGVDKEAYIVSFMDVRSAQKACSSHGGEPKLDGHQLRIQFHEPNMSSSSSTKNSAPSPTLAAGNQPFDRTIPSELITEELPKRTKTSGSSRPSSAMSTMEHINEKKKTLTSTATENDAYLSNFQASSSSRSSPCPSSSSPSPPNLQNHQKKIVRKKGTTTTESSADLRDVSLDKPSSANSMKNSSAEDKGLQGIYISQLPSSSNQLADKLSSVVRRHAKLIHIVYEHGANAKSALVLMQNVSNMEALLTTLNLTQLGGFQLKAKQANHVVVTEAYNNHLAVTSAAVSGAPLSKESLPLPPPPSIPGLFGEQSTSQPPIKPTSSGLLADKKKVISLKTSNINSSTSSALLAGVRSTTSSSGGAPPSTSGADRAPCISSIAYGGMSSSSVSNDPLSKNASRTLYVGNLEKKVTDHCLKTRYGIYGHILEVELKSRDTAAPFAFIQFTNIKSVATAIGASHTANKSASGASGEAQKPVKVGWGKSICSNKLWIGALPKSCSKDYLLSKMRVITPDDVTEVMYDPNHNETLVLFKTNDAAQVAYSKIKNRVLIFPPEKLQSQSGNTHVQVDYCSEKLHDFFVDRQFGRFGGALPAVDGLDESADSNECQIRQADQLIVAQKKAASTTGGIPDTLLLAPPPDPPKNLATDVIARGNEHLGASNNQNERSNLTSSSQQSILNASIVPPDPAMTSSSNSMEKSVIHRHNSSSSHRRQPVSSSPDPSSSRQQRHETPSSRHRGDGNERERSSDYTTSTRTAEQRDRRSTSHSYQSKKKSEEYIYRYKDHESSSRHGQLLASDRTRSSHSSHYSHPTGSSSHHNNSSLPTGSSSQQLHPEYTPSSTKKAATRKPGHRSSLSSSSTSSSGSSDSTSDSSASSDAIAAAAGAGRVRPSITRHSWEHRSRKKERGVEKSSAKRTETKINPGEPNSTIISSRHQSSKSLLKPSTGSGSTRNSSGRDKVFESTKSATSGSTSKERTEILAPTSDHYASKSRKNVTITGSNEKNRHSSSPLCPPPPMPSIASVVNPISSSNLKKLRRSEKVRDSSSSSSASTSSSVSDSQKQPLRQNRRSTTTEIKDSYSTKKLASVIETVGKAAPSPIFPSLTKEADKSLSSSNIYSEIEPLSKTSISSSSSTQAEEKLCSSTANLAKTILSPAITVAPLSAPLPGSSSSSEWVAGRRISHSISSGSSSQPSVKYPPRQLLKAPLNIPYSLKTSSMEVKDPRTGRLIHSPSSQMSLPLPKFASESGSFQCNWDKRSPANSISGSATGLDVVQRSPPMSATVQKSSFSSKFFSGSQQEDKEADAPQDPRGKDTSASLCSPAKSVDLEGSARSILGFSPEPEKPAKPKNFDPLAELFKNVAPAAPSSLAKRLTEFRNKYKDVEQKIQETKMNVFAASSSRKPTSLEQELERLQSRSNTLSGLSLDTTSHQDPLDMPKRSLSIHIPSSSARVNKPSSPSSTLQNLKKGFNLSNLEHDQYHSTPTSQSSPVLAKSEAGDQSLSFLPQNSQLRQSPQLATTTSVFQGTFRPSSSSVSSPRPINLPKPDAKPTSSLTRAGGSIGSSAGLGKLAVPASRQLHVNMPGGDTDTGMSSPSGGNKWGTKSTSSCSNSTPGSMRTPGISTGYGGDLTHPLSKTSMPPPKDSNRNNRILDDLFRQQANDTKRVVANKVEKKSAPVSTMSSGDHHHQQPSTSAVKEMVKKTSVVANASSSSIVEKDKFSEKYLIKMKRREERKKEEEMRERQSSSERHQQQKHQKDTKDLSSSNNLQKRKDKVRDEKPRSGSKPPPEKKEHESKSSQHNKQDKPHNKDKERDKEEQRKAAKQIAKAERRRKEEQEEKERQKEKKFKKQQQKASQPTQSSESEEEEEEDSDAGSNNSINLADFGLAGVDIEEQRRMMKQIKAGNFGMSMYDRVKRRSSAQKPENQKKKSKALEMLREKTGKKKKFNRIQLSSSDEDNDDDNTGDERDKEPREKHKSNEPDEHDQEEYSDTDNTSKKEAKQNPKRGKDRHHHRSDIDSDDGRASITSESTTATAPPSTSSAPKKSAPVFKKEDSKPRSVASVGKDEPKPKSVSVIDKEQPKAKSNTLVDEQAAKPRSVSVNEKEEPKTKAVPVASKEDSKPKLATSIKTEGSEQKSVESAVPVSKKQPAAAMPEIKTTKKVRSKEQVTSKEKDKSTTSSSNSNKEREKVIEKSEDKNKKSAVPVKRASSSSSSSSGSSSDEDGSDASSTDGDSYIKKLQKELSKCRSSSPANSAAGSDSEVKQKAQKSKPTKFASSTKDTPLTSNSKTSKPQNSKKPAQTKKVERLSMEDVYGQESSDEAEDVHNSTSSTVKSATALTTAKKEPPAEPVKEKPFLTTTTTPKQKSKPSMEDLFGVSDKPVIKKAALKKAAEPSSRKSTIDPLDAMFMKQGAKKVSVEEKTKSKAPKSEESGPKKKEKSQTPAQETESVKRKKKSSESTPSQPVNEPKKRKVEAQEEEKKKASKKRQASENEPSPATVKRVKTEPSIPSENKSASKEVKLEVLALAKPLVSPTSRKATLVKEVKQEPAAAATAVPVQKTAQQEPRKETPPPVSIPRKETTPVPMKETTTLPIAKKETTPLPDLKKEEKVVETPAPIPTKKSVEQAVTAVSSSSSSSSSSSGSSSSSESNDSSAEEQVTTPLKPKASPPKVQKSGNNSSSLAQIQSHHRRQFYRTGFHAPTKPQPPIITSKQGPSSPQSTSSQSTSSQLSVSHSTSKQQDSPQSTPKQLNSPQSFTSQITAKQLNSPQLTATQPSAAQPASKQLNSIQLTASQLNASQLSSKQQNSPQLSISQLTSPQLSTSQMTSPQLSSPQLTSPSSSNRPDRLSSIGPSTSLEEIAAEDVQKLVAELAASSSACNTFEVIDHGTVSAPTATPLPEIPSKPFTPTPKPAVKSSDPPAKPTVKSVEPASKITAPARRGRAPNMAAKKPSRTQLKFGSMPVIQPKVEEKVDDDLDSDEMEAELLRRMCEEEDMAVMNLTTEDGDDAFGKQQQQKPAVKKEQEPVEPVKPITSLLSPAQKDVNKTEEKVTASSVATLPPVAVVAPVKLASPKPPVLTSPKRADKAKVEPVERRSSNESMESSHMGSGGGYMEIDAEHLLKQQKEQEELEKKQEQERRKAEELARMEETVEAVIAAATRSSQQQSQIPQVVPPVAGSDTTSPYQTVQMQSSIDSRTPQSESSHGGSATPLSKPPLSNYAPSVIASQGSQQGSPVVQVGSGGPVVVVQVQQQQQKPYGSNLSQMYANPQQQRKSGVIMEEKGGHAQFSTHLVQSPASHGAIGGQASNGASVASVVVSNSSSSHMAQMIQQQQQKFVHQQQDHVQRQVVSQPQQPPVTGKRGKQQVARPQNVLVPTSQSESASAQHQQQGSTQQHQGLPQQHYPNQVNQQQHPAMPQQQAVPQRQPTPQQHQANSQQQHQANPQQQQPQVQGQVAQGQVIQGQPQGPEFGGIEQQNVNRLLAFYNLNFMNPPMATVTAVQQGQTQQQHTGQHQQQYVARSMQQEPQGQQQQTASNAAANAPTTAANVPAQLAARHWSSMVSATSVTQSSASNSGLINGDPASLELFRQQHAAQMQALQTQHPTNIPGGQSSTAPGQDLLLQQHLQAQQHRQISAQQQQPQQQSQQQQQNYGTAALRTAQKVQMSQQQQGRQEVVGQAEQQQRKPSSAQMQHHQQQNAVYMAHQQHQNAALLQQQQQQHHMYPQSQQQPQQQHVSPQMQQQHNNQADPQQQRNTNEKYPVLWQGQLAMKNTDTLVQMHRVCGNDKLIDITNQELVSRANGISTIRITQRMRLEQTQLESLMKKMEKEANYVALVCLPCGRNREDITVQTSRMTTHFIDYFTSKMAAGIVNQGPITPTPSCVAHVFPPSDFATGHLNRHAPDLLVTIEKHNAGYLFVVITTNN